MEKLFKIKLPDSIKLPSTYRQERLDELLSLMNDNEQVLGVLLGGSLSYKKDYTKSDVDLFCLIHEETSFEERLRKNLSVLNDVDAIIFQGIFPWTEKLYTVYFKEDIDFSIDLCLINSNKSNIFFWEPDGHILFDKAGIIESCRTMQMSSPGYTRHPFLKPNPFTLSVVTLKKIEKNLSRNHIWNALEQVNSFRRYILQIIRINEMNNDNFLGRVDRDIEDVIPTILNQTLSKTVAVYDAGDIAKKTILLIEIFVGLQKYLVNGSENSFHDWIDKQVKHEANKLQKYF